MSGDAHLDERLDSEGPLASQLQVETVEQMQVEAGKQEPHRGHAQTDEQAPQGLTPAHDMQDLFPQERAKQPAQRPSGNPPGQAEQDHNRQRLIGDSGRDRRRENRLGPATREQPEDSDDTEDRESPFHGTAGPARAATL